MFSYGIHLANTNHTIYFDRKKMFFSVYRMLKTTIQFLIYIIVCQL